MSGGGWARVRGSGSGSGSGREWEWESEGNGEVDVCMSGVAKSCRSGNIFLFYNDIIIFFYLFFYLFIYFQHLGSSRCTHSSPPPSSLHGLVLHHPCSHSHQSDAGELPG